jgi:hypothetical protein
MSVTVTISNDLAALLEERRKEEGLVSLDAAVEKLLAYALAVDDGEEDDLYGYNVEELRALIAEADASGPAEPWDGKAVREEVLRRYAERSRQS